MRLLIVAVLSALAIPAFAETSASDLTLTFGNVRSASGQVVVALFDSEAAYKAKDRPVRTATLPVSGESVNVAWSGLKPGSYAAVAFHDRDADGKLDTLPIGLPTEPYAISRDAPARFGPPAWRAAAFSIVPGANHQWAKLR